MKPKLALVLLAALLVSAALASLGAARVAAQQPTWSDWRPAGELVGVRYFERRKNVTTPQRGTYVQWRVENASTRDVFASVAQKRYMTDDGKVDRRYADQGESLRAGAKFTFPPEPSPTRGFVTRVQCTPVVVTE